MKRTLLALVVMALALPAIASDTRLVPADATPSSRITVAFTGDILIHGPIMNSARRGDGYDFRPQFRAVRQYLASADLAICHLEVPLSRDNTNLRGFPVFNAPREVADALVYAGYDGCTTASNHSLDSGVDGVVSTIDVLESRGLGQAGMARTEEESRQTMMYDVGGVKLASLSASFGFNGFELPAGRSYMANRINVDRLIADAERAKTEGADLVVVSIHCCVEYLTMPTAEQTRISHRLIESPYVDLVVTHHAHVVSPVEWVGGKPVLHGLGNILSNQSPRAGLLPDTQDGVIAMVTAERDPDGWRFVDVGVIPTWVDEPDQRHFIRIPGSDTASYARTMSAINRMGSDVVRYRLPALPGRIRSKVG